MQNHYPLHHIAGPRCTQHEEVVIWSGPCSSGRHEQIIEVHDLTARGILLCVQAHIFPLFPRFHPYDVQHYVIGVDGLSPHNPFVALVPKSVGTVNEAFKYTKPLSVAKAEAKGLNVCRQGDWWFIKQKFRSIAEIELENCRLWWPASWSPTSYLRTGIMVHTVDLTAPKVRWTNTYAERVVLTKACRLFVRGKITAPNCAPLELKEWHQAIRGRLLHRIITMKDI